MLALLPYMRPIVLLVGSNVFMTAAWYWHLRYKEVPLLYVIFISWGVAFIEILPGCTRQSLRQRSLRSGTIEDDPGGHHLCGVRRIFIRLFARAHNAQSRRRLRADCGRRFFRVSQVVTSARAQRARCARMCCR